MDSIFTEPTEEIIEDLKTKHGEIYSLQVGRYFLIFKSMTRHDLKEVSDIVATKVTEAIPESAAGQDIEALTTEQQNEFLLRWTTTEEEEIIKKAVIWPDLSKLPTEEFDKLMPAGLVPNLHQRIKEVSGLMDMGEVKKL